MKALSLKQPWAELVVMGRKSIELRTWNTKFRGEFLVHASGNADEKKCREFNIKNPLKGSIIGSAELESVKIYRTEDELRTDDALHLGTGFHSKYPIYGFILKNPKRISPIKWKGFLGFFNVDFKC